MKSNEARRQCRSGYSGAPESASARILTGQAGRGARSDRRKAAGPTRVGYFVQYTGVFPYLQGDLQENLKYLP